MLSDDDAIPQRAKYHTEHHTEVLNEHQQVFNEEEKGWQQLAHNRLTREVTTCYEARPPSDDRLLILTLLPILLSCCIALLHLTVPIMVIDSHLLFSVRISRTM